MGYSPWGHRESDMTEQLRTHTHALLYQFPFSDWSWSLCPAPNWTNDWTLISGFLFTVILDSPFQGFLLKQVTQSINHYRERTVLAV